MRVAITSDGNAVYPHFGYCPMFTIVEIEDGKASHRITLENPGHVPGFLPKYLQDKGVNLVVTGGMGQKAIRLFDQAGVEVIVGVSGSIDQVVEDLINGTLEGGESSCGHGEGHELGEGECGHHGGQPCNH